MDHSNEKITTPGQVKPGQTTKSDQKPSDKVQSQRPGSGSGAGSKEEHKFGQNPQSGNKPPQR